MLALTVWLNHSSEKKARPKRSDALPKQLSFLSLYLVMILHNNVCGTFFYLFPSFTAGKKVKINARRRLITSEKQHCFRTPSLFCSTAVHYKFRAQYWSWIQYGGARTPHCREFDWWCCYSWAIDLKSILVDDLRIIIPKMLSFTF